MKCDIYFFIMTDRIVFKIRLT